MACTGHVGEGTCDTHVNTGTCISHVGEGTCAAHANSCPSHSGYEPPLSELTFTDGVLNDTITAKTSHINELRAGIDAELERRGGSAYWDGTGVTTDTQILATTIQGLRLRLNDARSTTFNVGIIESGQSVLGGSVQEIRDKLNVARAECACNCNYACTCNCNYACTCNCNYDCTCNCNYDCTCNCNYSCTCNCNYSCTCNCNYACTCNCNYTCTCNCNYSDERLKKDIIYL